MWNDVEAKTDLLNFSHVASAAAQIILDAAGEPITIGVSGNWGSGKSSLVKMIGAKLQATPEKDKFVYLEFNAWLYQGYDDARQALLDAVGDRLVALATERKTFVKEALDFVKRIKLLRVFRMIAPVGLQAAIGGAIGGPLGALVGAVSGMVNGGTVVAEDVEKVKAAYKELSPELEGLLKEKGDSSLPKEIEGLRSAFKKLLTDLDVTLVVLVDDLDRCLPPTAISTLEAMRLLLLVERTAFIIAADEEMIRSSVRAHFKDADISSALVTSYFDKLIQVPLQVPRLGVTEVKAYLALLFADLAFRRKKISEKAFKEAQEAILQRAQKGWLGLSGVDLRKAFGAEVGQVEKEIDLADQLAGILATAEQIAGNPRLIKRFLNNLLIREAIAKGQEMNLGFPELVKLQLFERCASSSGFEHLAKAVAESTDGKVQFLAELEAAAEKGEPWKAPPQWPLPFYEQWVKLSPPLGGVNLRPLLHLSRDRKLAIAAYDELGPEAQEILEAILAAEDVLPALVDQIKTLSEADAERLLVRAGRHARNDQFSPQSIQRCLHITRAYPNLGPRLANLLTDVPPARRPLTLIPLLQVESWASGLLSDWSRDPETPPRVKKAIAAGSGSA